MKYQKGYVGLGDFAVVVFVGAVVGGFILYISIPWFWGLAKSWIHSVSG